MNTTRFGPFTFDEEAVLSFPRGIPGFETHTEWVIAGDDEAPIKWLQSLSDGDVALPVARPAAIMDEYSPRFADEDLEEVRQGSDEGLILLLVLSIPEGRPWEMTANLRAPIVLQHIRRVGKQIICLNEEYSIRHGIFAREDRTAEEPEGEFPEQDASPLDEEEGDGMSKGASRRKDAC